MSSVRISWNLQALLGVLQGAPSAGQALVRSTGATGTVPKHAVAIPVIDGAIDSEAAIVVEPNPAVADGSWPVTSAGVLVDASSLQSGVRVNLPLGTPLVWSPPLTGIEERSEVGTALTGGTQLDTWGALKQIRAYKDMGTRPQAEDVYKAQVTQLPAVVLTWVATVPADGSGSGSLGPRGVRVGRGVVLMKHRWILHVITSRLDSSDLRKREGEALRDDLLTLLAERTAYRGLGISGPDGLEVLDARLEVVSPGHFVDAISFATTFGLKRRDLEPLPSNWVQTRILRQVPPLVPPQDADEPALIFPDVTDPMPPNT